MFRLQDRPLKRCLLAPVSDGVAWVAFFGAVVFLVPSGWSRIGAAAYLILFEWRAYRLDFRADSDGLVVTNRFMRHRIPWHQVRVVWSQSKSTRANFIPTLVIHRRGSAFFSVSVYAALGMRREDRRAAALEIVRLASEYGHVIMGGEDSDIDAQRPVVASAHAN
jgi:hypothetical protein